MIKVLLVAAEAAPFVKTGGLGDVVGTLPKELRRQGVDARVIIPKYGNIDEGFRRRMTGQAVLNVPVGWRNQYCGIEMLEYEDVPFYFVDNEYYFKRSGMYGYFDEAERYAFFCRAVLAALPHIDFVPHILHSHDWHAGLVSVYYHAFYRQDPLYAGVRNLFTVHNLKYQGSFPKETLTSVVGLGWDYFTVDGLEYHDKINFMKGGLVFADHISTVSRTYAAEIQFPYFGEGLDGLLRRRRDDLHGIVNGIDYEIYNPASDPNIFVPYNRQQLIGKRHNKVKLQKMLGLPADPEKPLLGVISRLVEPKGLDLIARVLNEIMALDVQMAVTGTGDYHYEQMFWAAAGYYPDKISVRIPYDESLARKIFAASDLFLMPSRYEPCGISQLMAMRYGSLPVVRATGGLKDTVRPYNEYTGGGNGFCFADYNAHDMLHVIEKALRLYREKGNWSAIVKNTMRADHSWRDSAKAYRELYHQLYIEEFVFKGAEDRIGKEKLESPEKDGYFFPYPDFSIPAAKEMEYAH